MKYKCSVTIEKTLLLDIPDKLLNEETLKEFQESIDRSADCIEDLVKHAAYLIALYPNIYFVEGIGKVSPLNDGNGIYVAADELDELGVNITLQNNITDQ